MNDRRSLFDATSATVETAIAPVQTPVDYHDRPELSRGNLALFAKSHRKFEGQKITGMLTAEPDSTDEMDIGNATHAHVLEPDKFQKDFTIWCGQPMAKKTKSKKLWNWSRVGPKWKQWSKDTRSWGMEILTIRQYCEVLTMGMLAKHRLAKWINIEDAELPEGVTLKVYLELELYWVERQYDGKEDVEVPCRAKLDYLVVRFRNGVAEAAWILDVKTARDAEHQTFKTDSKKHFYWLQVPHYSAGVHAHFGIDFAKIQFNFVIIDKETCKDIAGRVHDLVTKEIEEKVAVEIKSNPNYEFDHATLAAAAQAKMIAALDNDGKGVGKLAVRYKKLDPGELQEAYSKRDGYLRAYVKCKRTNDWSDPGEDDVIPVMGAITA